jgi:hypothetical protein
MLRWTSGNAPNNVFYISNTRPDQFQNQPTALEPYPMAAGSICFVDTQSQTGVPALCGALQLKLYESSLGIYPTGTFLNFAPQCISWAIGPTTSVNDEGLAHIFMSTNNTAQNPCVLPRISIPSFEEVEFFNVIDRIVGIVVPENLLLQIQFSSLGLLVKIGPGTYTVDSLRIIEPRWPLTLVTSFLVYCSTVNPRSIFIAKMCSGFAGAKSSVYVPQSSECDFFMRNRCVVDQMFNSSVCGCYQDQQYLSQLGLPEPLTAQMVNRPQCFGSVCALGSAYRQEEWLESCGNVCQQALTGNGDKFQQAGVQVLACGGDIYNFSTDNKASVSEAPVDAWVIALLAIVATAAVVFLVLFAVYVSKKPKDQKDEKDQKTKTAQGGARVSQ